MRLRTSLLVLTVASLALASACRESSHSARVEILRDNFGVPHIFGASLADALYGQAYCHAEDNLDLLLESLAASRGESARFRGRGQLRSDLIARAFDLADLARRDYEALAPGRRALVDTYASGVNRFLADRPERRPSWLESVRGVDIIAISRLHQLRDAMATARRDFSGSSRKPRKKAGGDIEEDGGESNMWALRPDRTVDGSVVLLSDPHLSWNGPIKWHESHLIVGDRWIYGVTIPGAPGFAIGFTQDIAWGLTNNGADVADVYRIPLDPGNPERYRFDGGWRDLTLRTFRIVVRQPDGSLRSVERNVRYSHHGPILKRDRSGNVAFAARATVLDTQDFGLWWVGNFNARNLEEFEAALDTCHLPKWHCIVTDRRGNIGYYYFAAVHRRSDAYRWDAPVDGSVSATEWGPPLSWRDLPHTSNPPSGYVMNCNNNAYTVTRDCPLKPEDYPEHLMSRSTELSPQSRAFRARELIEAKAKHDLRSVSAIATDIETLDTQPWLDLLLGADRIAGATLPDPGQRRRNALTALEHWDLRATTDNVALPILCSFLRAARHAGRATTDTATDRRTPGRISELSAAEVLAVLDDGLDLLRERWGSDPVPWGKMHVIRRGDHLLPMPGVGSNRYADPFTSLFLAGAKEMTDGRFECEVGSSWIQLVRFVGGSVQAQTVVPFGNSNEPDSPHYADQMPLFAARSLKRALVTRRDIEAAAERRVKLDLSYPENR